jgi:hypothetical protein
MHARRQRPRCRAVHESAEIIKPAVHARGRRRRRKGNPAQPQPVREFLVAGTFPIITVGCRLKGDGLFRRALTDCDGVPFALNTRADSRLAKMNSLLPGNYCARK